MLRSMYISVQDLGDSGECHAIRKTLGIIPGVMMVGIGHRNRCIAVDFDPEKISEERICRVLTAIGVKISEIRSRL